MAYSTATMIAAGTAQLFIECDLTPARNTQQGTQLVLELVQLRALEMRGAAAELHRRRVHRPAILQHLVVQVRARRQAGRTHIADHLALADVASRNSSDSAHVTIHGRDSAGMRDLDHLPLA